MKKKMTIAFMLFMILIAGLSFLITRRYKNIEAELFLNDWEGYICASNEEVFILDIP